MILHGIAYIVEGGHAVQHCPARGRVIVHAVAALCPTTEGAGLRRGEDPLNGHPGGGHPLTFHLPGSPQGRGTTQSGLS